MKVLLTGSSGLFGGYIYERMIQQNSLLCLFNNASSGNVFPGSVKADITDHSLIRRIIFDFEPELVIHTAAVSRPELEGRIPDKLFYDINVNAVKNIAESCCEVNAKLIYTSTDLVYDGSSGSMLNEAAKLNPISLYAETKLIGEEKIRETFDKYLILRVCLLFGYKSGNTINSFYNMYRNFSNGEKVNLFYDQYRTPLYLPEAARIISELGESEITGETINFGGRERISRTGLGELLCEEGGFDKALINSMSLKEREDLPQVADVSLDTSKLQSYGIRQLSLRESVRDFLAMVTGRKVS